MYTHLYLGSGIATLSSPALTFWKTVTYEELYMFHLTLHTIAIFGVVATAPLFVYSVSKNLSVGDFVKVSVFDAINIFVFFEAFWTVVWFILEYFAPADFAMQFIIPYGDKYFAWGVHPFFPVLYWFRSQIWFAALIITVFVFVNMVIISSSIGMYYRSTLISLLGFFLISLMFGNLVYSFWWGILPISLLILGIITIIFYNIPNNRILIPCITLILVIGLFMYVNAGLSKPLIIANNQPVYLFGTYGVGSAEYIPSYSYSNIMFAVYGDGSVHNITVSAYSMKTLQGGSVELSIPFNGSFYSSVMINTIINGLSGDSVFISIQVDSPDCYIVLLNDLKLQLGPFWLGGIPGELVGVNYV